MSDSPPAVIFDMDGVLCDTIPLHQAGWERIARQLGVALEPSDAEAFRGRSRAGCLELLLARGGIELDARQRAALLEAKNRDFLARVAQLGPGDRMPGSAALIDDLRARGVRLAVASSSRNTRAVLGQLGLLEVFDAVVDLNDVPRSKPAPDLFLTAARRLDVPPARCVVIEDSAAGVQAARAAGMRVIGVGPQSRLAAADRVVPSLSALEADAVLRLL